MLKKSLIAGLLASSISAYAGHVKVYVGGESAGMGTVTAVDKNFAEGAKVALKATAAKGYAFAGWYIAGEPASLDTDWRNPASTYVAGAEDVEITAEFVAPGDDFLDFDLSETFAWFEIGESAGEPLELGDSFASVSFPSVTVSGLPAGLKFDAKKLTLGGAPTKPGRYTVSVSAKNASGYKYAQAFECRVGNVSSDRVSGVDYDGGIYAGEEVDVALEDIFDIGDEFVSITLSGLPAGLKLVKEDESYYVRGTVSKAGDFVVTAKVTFPTDAEGANKKTTESATALWTVLPPDPADYGVDFYGISELAVGSPVYAEDAVVGEYDNESKTGVTKISGLPSGLSAVKFTDGVTVVYAVEGTPSACGFFNATATVSYMDDETGKKKTATVSMPVYVADSASVFVNASVFVPEDAGENFVPGGSVSGYGVYHPGEKVTLKAAPAKGCVFAGWCDFEGEPVSAPGTDYRATTQTFVLSADSILDWSAGFASAEDDAFIAISDLEEMPSFSSDEPAYIPFYVDSISAPSVTVTGLPKGFSLEADGEDAGWYSLSYNPETAKDKPAPGFYEVVVKAVNVSKASDTAVCMIQIQNWMSDAIDVEDDLGEFVPGEEIDPLDFSGVVDFDKGVTLAVSGLPKGLVFNAKANESKGIEANTVTGKPTAPGIYTIVFTAKVPVSSSEKNGKIVYAYGKESEVATATLTVLPYPELAVEVDEDAAAAGCKVSGAGNYPSGTKVSLKATPAKDYVFIGWDGLGEDASILDVKNPALSYVTGADDAILTALFVHVSEDWLYVWDAGDLGVEESETEPFVFALNEPVAVPSAVLDLVDSGSLPSVSAAGLPAGVKLDSKTLLLSGKPTKPGVFYVTLSAKNTGGYTFVRVVRAVVLNADGTEPEEPNEQNDAEIGDLDNLDGMFTTGIPCLADDKEDVEINIPGNPATGAAVSKVAVSGLPDGLSATVEIDSEFGDAVCSISGIPSKPGRFTAVFAVTYADKKSAKSVKSFIVEDGGSSYLSVYSADESLGTVTGGGVYSAGSKIKLSAKAADKKCVFSGWKLVVSAEAEGGEIKEVAVPYYVMQHLDGVDYRSASATVTFLSPEYYPIQNVAGGIAGTFIPAEEDESVEIVFTDDGYEEGEWGEDVPFVFEIDDLDSSKTAEFMVLSETLPKVTVKDLPKGLAIDLVRGVLSYDSSDKAAVVPGVHTVTLTAVNQTKKSTTREITVTIPNKTCDAIDTNPEFDAYPLMIGMPAGDVFEATGLNEDYAEDGWTLSASGLPAGVTFKNGVFSGTPSKAGAYTVTLSAKKKGEETQVATITVIVEALPAWAVGTFNGESAAVQNVSAENELRFAGSSTVTITDKGALSGSLNLVPAHGTGAKKVSFKAAAISETVEIDGGLAPLVRSDADEDEAWLYPQEGETAFVYRDVEFALGTAKYRMDVYVYAMGADEDGNILGRVSTFLLENTEEDGVEFVASQSVWSNPLVPEPVFAGKPVATVDVDGELEGLSASLVDAGIEKLEFSFGAKGAVSVKAFKQGAKSASETVSAQMEVLRQFDGGTCFVGQVIVALPKSGAAARVWFKLEADGDGKIHADGIVVELD